MGMRNDIDQLPIIDFCNRRDASKHLVKACEEYGFFKVINHGVPQEMISQVEEEAHQFFEKHEAGGGPPHPFRYGCKSIGLKGDVGDVEYLIIQASSFHSSDSSNKFRCAVNAYLEAVRTLACEILDMIEEELNPKTSSALSKLIKDSENDSILRFNHYHAVDASDDESPPPIRFGEHTDPQILTLLRSNGVEGLQISLKDGVWVTVNPHPESAFYVNVGDMLQVMTNGRFVSVKHRVAVQSYESRLSTSYFVAPPLHTTIRYLSGMATVEKPPLFRSFMWREYKERAMARRLGESSLALFALPSVPSA